MGTFGGHTLPGSFFIIFAVWWTVSQFRRYYQSRLKNGAPYQNTATFKFFFLCGRLRTMELEAIIKIFFTAVGFMGEIITGTKNGKFVHLGNGQHATMFFFFGMTGVIDLLLHFKVPLPKSMNYATVTLALMVEGCLFRFHLHGRADLDVIIHTLLLYVIAVNIIAVLVEMKFEKSVMAGLGRSYCTFLQGTWFWQVAFILYNPLPGAQEWDEDDHGQIMIATMIFAWHMGGVFIIMLLIGGVVACVYRCQGELEINNYSELKMQLLQKGSNGHTAVDLQGDSDSDIEFQRPLASTGPH